MKKIYAFVAFLLLSLSVACGMPGDDAQPTPIDKADTAVKASSLEATTATKGTTGETAEKVSTSTKGDDGSSGGTERIWCRCTSMGGNSDIVSCPGQSCRCCVTTYNFSGGSPK